MTQTNLFTLTHLIDHCKGIIPYQTFLIHLIKPLIERALTKLKNVFIIRTELQNRIDYEQGTIPYIRIWWSADNHTTEMGSLKDQTVYDLSEILTLYRDYKIDSILKEETLQA